MYLLWIRHFVCADLKQQYDAAQRKQESVVWQTQRLRTAIIGDFLVEIFGVCVTLWSKQNIKDKTTSHSKLIFINPWKEYCS
jgi:hypothetical protein